MASNWNDLLNALAVNLTGKSKEVIKIGHITNSGSWHKGMSNLLVQQVQINMITTDRVKVSQPSLNVPNLQSLNDKVPFIGPHYLPKCWGKKPKATTKVTLYEPPMIAIAIIVSVNFTLNCFCTSDENSYLNCSTLQEY